MQQQILKYHCNNLISIILQSIAIKKYEIIIYYNEYIIAIIYRTQLFYLAQQANTLDFKCKFLWQGSFEIFGCLSSSQIAGPSFQ